MFQHASLIRSLAFSTLILVVPVSVFARGGSGGHGGGGGHMGGGGMGRGGHGFSSGPHGYTGGYRGPAAGFNGHYAAYRGGPGYHGNGWGYRGYGYGYPGYGWGYPYYGYGLGLGLGLGLGYGLGAGYGYGGYGYGGYGYGYPGYGAYNGTTYYNTTYNTNAVAAPISASSNAAPMDDAAIAKAREFIQRGDAAFKAGKYEDAVYAWRHAVVDDPQNTMLVLQLSQGLLATGKYEEAAGAAQAAMRQLPKEQWGTVISRYQDLYGNPHDYTQQLRSLERAIKLKPNDPSLRFLAGYHYGYLSFYQQSVEQLDKVIELEPRDDIAPKLRDEMKNHLPTRQMPPALLPVPPAPAPDDSGTNLQ